MLGGWADAEIATHEADLGSGETLVLCTDGWLEVGAVGEHRSPDAFAAMSQSLAGLELEQLTDRLRRDALDRGDGALRDDLVVLAMRPQAGGERSDAEASAASVPVA